MKYKIPFNRPYLAGKELEYIQDSFARGHISGNGHYTRLCQQFLEKCYGFGKCLLTNSGTDALEMCAILLDIREGDEVIMPSFTFVSTANAFVLRGARPVFVDSRDDHPGMDETKVEKLITSRTKAIVCVHYAGVACDMDIIMEVAKRHGIFVVEDAAHAIDSYYKERPLGGIGHLAAFSFHETKNIISGEGGMLVVNDKQFSERAEILWEKGTNRTAFLRGEVDKYGWVDIGSSFLLSDLNAAILWAQVQALESIQVRRKAIWESYYSRLKDANLPLRLPVIPKYASNNGHLFYAVLDNAGSRSGLLDKLKSRGIHAVIHYQALHASKFFRKSHKYEHIVNAEIYTDRLIRLPFFVELSDDEIKYVVEEVISGLKEMRSSTH